MDTLYEPHKFTTPWRVCSNESSFWIEDATGMRFAYIYYTDTPIVGTRQEKPTKDEARRIASNIAKLPGLLATGSRRGAGP